MQNLALSKKLVQHGRPKLVTVIPEIIKKKILKITFATKKVKLQEIAVSCQIPPILLDLYVIRNDYYFFANLKNLLEENKTESTYEVNAKTLAYNGVLENPIV